MAFKMTEQVEQRICITFCIKLEHSLCETIWMIQKATATGNWWLEASFQQCTHSCITSGAEIFGETSNHPGDSVPTLQHRFGALPCDFWLFSKLKSRLKGKRFQTIDENQENMIGQLMVIGRTVWGPKMPTLKGTEMSLSYVQCFLYLVSSSINVSIFHISWLVTFWTDLIICDKLNTQLKLDIVRVDKMANPKHIQLKHCNYKDTDGLKESFGNDMPCHGMRKKRSISHKDCHLVMIKGSVNGKT